LTAVVRSKVQAIVDHVRRIREVDPGTEQALRDDILRQESILLNVQRACQAAIDLANHLVDVRKLGTPDDSRDAFVRLERAGLLPAELGQHLRGMVGFRNIAVHRYHELDLRVLRSILDSRLPDLLQFAELGGHLVADPAGS
jgi:uncharacterized protein YutE (UPF0331/DUF86 family)